MFLRSECYIECYKQGHVALMGTITSRRSKDGSARYTAQIRLKKDGKVVLTESETFGRRALAVEWLRNREAQLDKLRARGEVVSTRYTLGELIKWYRVEVGKTADWGRSKEADLLRLERYSIAKLQANALTVANYIEHAETRRDEGAGPTTVGNDLVWIGQVLRSARSSLNVMAQLDLLADARHELRQRKLIAKSRYRDRRPTADEETKLLAYFKSRDCRSEIPMHEIMLFAIASSRRQEEITRLKRVDLEPKKCIAWLDDVKHPRQKKGNRRSFRMLDDAWAIIERQPVHSEIVDGQRVTSPLVFPYNPKSISAAFTRACELLGIVNLRFHDLRHEATSRLFERGYAIQEVAHFTLHESWATLKRYTHLKPENVVTR